MAINSLRDVYIDQLKDLYSANEQSAAATGSLAAAASNSSLKEALERGQAGIHDGMSTLSQIIRAHEEEPSGEHCRGMEGLALEAKAHAIDEEFNDSDARDAMIISQYQRMAHYAIAGYGCLVAFANRLELGDNAKQINECLDACYDGDRSMTKLAESGINQSAV